MSEISKQALLVENNQSFPNNNIGAISPSDLRAFNTNMIDSLVDEISYNVDSASWNNSISALNTFSASQQPSFTALNSFTASQLTINSGINLFTQSANGRLGALENDTANLEIFTSSINQIIVNGVSIGTSTRLWFNGFVSASIIPNVGGPIASITILADQTFASSASFNEYTASTNTFTASAKISISALNSYTASQNSFNASATASLVELLNLSSSLSGGYATQGELDQSASVLQGNINSLSASQNLLNLTFATTGSNTFTGDQTLIDNAGNFFTISDASGSMMLVAKGSTSASLHLSASAAGIGNFIFKTNSNTADTIISGSGNIFTNPAAPTAGFKRYIGGNGNIINTVNAPQISGSMQFSPSMGGNYQVGAITMRGPVSSSAWGINANIIQGTLNIGTTAVNNAEKLTSGLTVGGNYVGGFLNILANQSALTGSTTTLANNLVVGTAILALSSSAVSAVNNIVNDNAFTFTNQFYSSSVGLGLVSMNRNTIAGQANSITVSGSQITGTVTAPSFSDNFIGGGSNIIYGDIANAAVIGTGAYHQAIRNIVFGNGLIITGSSLLGDTNSFGSAFFGRWNSVAGNSDLTAQTVFAVGTGTSTTRKTGFLIDSGSNTIIEGSLNVSGSLSVTGSISNNVFSASIVSSTASIDFSSASFFTLTLPATTNTHINVQNIRPGQSAMLEITTAGAAATASFSTNVYQPSASFYVPSNVAGNDILTFSSFASNKIYLVSVKTMINA